MALIGNLNEIESLRNDATGWRGLIDGLVHVLSKFECDITVEQVKEKFGGLRFYVYIDSNAHEHDALHGHRWIETAEEASFLLCYVCGAGVTHQGSGSWVRFFCAEHDTHHVMANRSASPQTQPTAADPLPEIEH